MIGMLLQKTQNAKTQKLFTIQHSLNNPPSEHCTYDFWNLITWEKIAKTGSNLIGGCRKDF